MKTRKKESETETIRIARMTGEERRLMRTLSPEERKHILLNAIWARYEQKGRMTQVNTIDILRGSFGDPHGTHYGIDPYWNTEGGWNENSRGDGGSYSGVADSVHRLPGESDEDFQRRAGARADELEETI